MELAAQFQFSINRQWTQLQKYFDQNARLERYQFEY